MKYLPWLIITYLAIGHYIAPFMMRLWQSELPIESKAWRIILCEIFAIFYLPIFVLCIIFGILILVLYIIWSILKIPYQVYCDNVLSRPKPKEEQPDK